MLFEALNYEAQKLYYWGGEKLMKKPFTFTVYRIGTNLRNAMIKILLINRR